MPVFVYNSLTRKKEELIPLSPQVLNIYSCGVTVYDESHIGHARSLCLFDVIRRYLKFSGYRVHFVRNITDIDDKIINRAKELKIDWQELVKKYIARYYEDLEALGIQKADAEPRATENIPEMMRNIEALIQKGYAYVTESGVYFNVRKFSDYGKLSGQSIEQMQSGVRIEPDENKNDPLDFALWKKSKIDEPGWVSPWGQGRPGWHIECSTMSMKYLRAETLDIHAGGRDLIFPHHENEIAQAEALTGELFAKYWLHHGLLTIDGQKMAKSQGNFISIKDFIARHKDAEVLKLFFLFAHYSHPIDYNEAKIEETKQALERILILLDKVNKKITKSLGHQVNSKSFKEIDEIKNKFIQAMDDDFNTPQALASIFELVNATNKNIDDLEYIYNSEIVIKELLDIFGISLKKHMKFRFKEDIQVENKVRIKIKERDNARQSGHYALADKIRKELEAEGIILEDTPEGTVVRKKI